MATAAQIIANNHATLLARVQLGRRSIGLLRLPRTRFHASIKSMLTREELYEALWNRNGIEIQAYDNDGNAYDLSLVYRGDWFIEGEWNDMAFRNGFNVHSTVSIWFFRKPMCLAPIIRPLRFIIRSVVSRAVGPRYCDCCGRLLRHQH